MKVGRALCFMFLAMTAGPACGENLINLPPEMRLTRGSAERGEAALNVIVTRLDEKDMPDTVAQEIKARLIMCLGNLDEMKNVSFFGWYSDWNRQQKLPQSFLVDFGHIKQTQLLPSCETDPFCNEEGCALMGFAAVKDGQWRQDFDIYVTKAQFGELADKQGVKHAEIDALSNKKKCKEESGLETDQGCFRRFYWRSYGLSVLPPLTP